MVLLTTRGPDQEFVMAANNDTKMTIGRADEMHLANENTRKLTE